jgi:hypothetical protein
MRKRIVAGLRGDPRISQPLRDVPEPPPAERAVTVAADERVVAGDDGAHDDESELGDVRRRELAEQRAVTGRRDPRGELADVVRGVARGAVLERVVGGLSVRSE